MEAINSSTLSYVITNEPEKRDEYIAKFVQLAKTLHSTEIKDDTVASLKSYLYSKLDDEYLLENLKQEEIAALRNIVYAMKEDNCVLHGDLNPGNIMMQNGELTLIDMGGVTRGTPMYDLACTFRALFFIPKHSPEICRRSFGLEPELAVEIGKKFFSLYTGITDDHEMEQFMQRLSLVFCFFFVLELPTSPGREQHGQEVIERMLRGIVIPNADSIESILSM